MHVSECSISTAQINIIIESLFVKFYKFMIRSVSQMPLKFSLIQN